MTRTNTTPPIPDVPEAAMSIGQSLSENDGGLIFKLSLLDVGRIGVAIRKHWTSTEFVPNPDDYGGADRNLTEEETARLACRRLGGSGHNGGHAQEIGLCFLTNFHPTVSHKGRRGSSVCAAEDTTPPTCILHPISPSSGMA
jgi:hypothetical protein